VEQSPGEVLLSLDDDLSDDSCRRALNCFVHFNALGEVDSCLSTGLNAQTNTESHQGHSVTKPGDEASC
jgi:hypothetical protein